MYVTTIHLFLNEFLKTKTKQIIRDTGNLKNQSKLVAKRGKTCTKEPRLVLALLLIGQKSRTSSFKPIIVKHNNEKVIAFQHTSENRFITLSGRGLLINGGFLMTEQ